MRALPKKEKPQTLKKERTEMDRNLDATGATRSYRRSCLNTSKLWGSTPWI
jgi:hypothetical protein